jgi:hypothetical protein
VNLPECKSRQLRETLELIIFVAFKIQAYLNRSARNHINDSMNEEFIPPRFKIARELTQEDEKQLGAAWATASSVVGAGV